MGRIICKNIQLGNIDLTFSFILDGNVRNEPPLKI